MMLQTSIKFTKATNLLKFDVAFGRNPPIRALVYLSIFSEVLAEPLGKIGIRAADYRDVLHAVGLTAENRPSTSANQRAKSCSRKSSQNKRCLKFVRLGVAVLAQNCPDAVLFNPLVSSQIFLRFSSILQRSPDGKTTNTLAFDDHYPTPDLG